MSKVEELKGFLQRSRTDLSKGGPAKERFVAKVMGHVNAIMTEQATPAKTAQPVSEAPKAKPRQDTDRVMQIKAKNLPIGPGGIAQMDGSQSMQADIDNGNCPFVGGSNGQ